MFAYNTSIQTLQSLAKQARKQLGFTLTELMVTLAILAILLTIAVPSFQQTIASSRLTTATNDLYTMLVQARSDAIRQGQRMTICKSSDSLVCDASVSWSSGLITIGDSSHSTTVATLDSAAGETITFAMQAIHPSIVFIPNAGIEDYISFTASGEPKTYTGSFTAVTIRVCSTSSALTDTTRARDLKMTAAGRIVITKPPAAVAATCNTVPTATT
jgi:type IV fimbrial biogenesis protein FimT